MVLRFFVIHSFPFTRNFPFQFRTRPHPKAHRPSTQAKLGDRQISHPLAGRGKNSVAERRHKRRHSRLTNAGRRSVAIDDVYVRLFRNLINSSYGIILKIRLVDDTLRSRDLAGSCNTRPEHRGALELGSRRFWIYYQPRIQNRIHAGDPHFTLIIDLHLNDRCHIRQETTVRRNPDASSLPVLPLSPSRFLGHHLCDSPQATGFPRILIHGSSIIRVLHTFEIDGAEYPNYGASMDEYPWETGRLRRVTEMVAEKSGWGKRKHGKGTGVGIAAHRSFLTYVATVVEVEVNNQGEVRIPRVDTVLDAGLVVNPEATRAQFEGAAVFGTRIARTGEITATKGVIDQSNFQDYPVARINEVPKQTNVYIVDSDAPPAGVGEQGVPPFVAAFCNAIFAATGKRVRDLPITKLGLS